LKKAIRVLRRFHEGRFPSIGQIADELNWPREQAQFLLDLSKTAQVSLDAPLKDDTQGSFSDVIADDAPGPYDIVAVANEHEVIERVLATLPDREREILKMRFGLDRTAELTLEEIGNLYQLTRERIRQIEVMALKRLRHPVRSTLLRELIDFEIAPSPTQVDEPNDL
jgi:RNA polymerase sigma factor (sigma-70 family)